MYALNILIYTQIGRPICVTWRCNSISFQGITGGKTRFTYSARELTDKEKMISAFCQFCFAVQDTI